MLTLTCLMALSAATPVPHDAPVADGRFVIAASYTGMSREQLLRERVRLVDARPGVGLAWLGAILGVSFSGTAFAFSAVGFGSEVKTLGYGLLGPGVICLAVAVASIYWIVTRSSERHRLGSELDILDDLIESTPRVAIQRTPDGALALTF